ncbi:MAG: outer membrane lipoprotein carrier protein LolA [Bacteroidetes bacterium]|jgi:outer membrane lipoprotein-sorting protein|nr:outer membrane lipoprotein carrier protein LolA [Bacteroidota bacterium]
MRFIFLLLISLFSGALFAQPAGYKIIKDPALFKTKFAEASQKIASIQSDFVQVKNLSMLNDKVTSKGKFYYKKSNKVRIEYTSPYQYLMVLNNNQMLVKDEQKTSNYNTRSNKMMQSINNIMLDCMRGTVYQNKEFNVQVLEGSKDYLLQLNPVTTVMKKMFQRIEVYLDKSDFNVIRLNMVEQGGDNSLMTFSNRVMNTNLNESLFAIR